MKIETIRKIPNILTVIRAILVPIFMFIIIFNNPNPNGESFRIFEKDYMVCIVGAAIFLLISLTDMFDGKIARKYNAVTDFGKFLDPIADKLLVMGGMLAIIVYYTQRTVWSRGYNVLIISMIFSLFIIIARELIVTSLRIVAMGEGIVIAAQKSGKLKTFIQIVGIVFLFTPLRNISLGFMSAGDLAVWIMVAITVISGIEYFKSFGGVLKTSVETEDKSER